MIDPCCFGRPYPLSGPSQLPRAARCWLSLRPGLCLYWYPAAHWLRFRRDTCRHQANVVFGSRTAPRASSRRPATADSCSTRSHPALFLSGDKAVLGQDRVATLQLLNACRALGRNRLQRIPTLGVTHLCIVALDRELTEAGRALSGRREGFHDCVVWMFQLALCGAAFN